MSRMASNSPSQNPSLLPVIGPDGLAQEAPAIAYTEKIIEEEQFQLRKYIEENYSKIRDVERELASLNMEVKLTAGPKKAALEHMRKKIEISTERIRLAKQKEEQARKAWEEASQAVKNEEEMKQKLCEDLNQLVQESSNTQLARLEGLKRRMEALNPARASSASLPHDGNSAGPTQSSTEASALPANNSTESVPHEGNGANIASVKKKSQIHGRGRGIGAVPKGRAPGWTGAGFDS